MIIRAQHSGCSRTTIYQHAHRVVQAVFNEQAGHRAYRLIIVNNPYAPENLWEIEQPHIDNLSRSGRTFGHHMKQRFFLNEKALNWENLRIWHTHYKPKPAHEDVPNWQAYLE